MVKTENLSFQYQQGQETFNFPDLNLNANENLLILGKSGIGKTTFLHLLAGLLKPSGGKIALNETNINDFSPSKLDAFRGEQIGIVFQKKHAIQALTVIENLKARQYFSKSKIDESFINSLLEELDLLALKNRKPQQLSEGQLQRLGIAMAVIHKPKVIFADEPTSSLDDENCEAVIKLLKSQADNYKANLIVITHDQRIQSFFQNTIEL